MEAFVMSSAFTGRRAPGQWSQNIAPRKTHVRYVVQAKKAGKPQNNAKNTARKNPAPPSSGFGGMAAGPGAPSRTKPQTALSKKKPAPAPTDNQEEPALTDNNSSRTNQTTPADSDPAEPRAVRALGQKKPPPVPVLRAKTAAEFIAEGVEDDVDEEFAEYEEADIRFGIDNVLDPFKEDEDANEAVLREADAETQLANVGKLVDITGDGGVTKKLAVPGAGDVVSQGAQVTVEYTGTLDDGSVFDSTRNRDTGFSFELGAGRVIKGWEAGVATMRKGEIAEFSILSRYAYGRRGMPPVIPSNATLTFEIELKDFTGGDREDIKKVSDFNPDIARTPSEIAKEYDARLQTQAERKKKMTLLDRFYIISPFASQTGERPPWWINPNITFVGIMVFVALGFYLVVVAGGIHVGYVDHPVDVNIFK